ncbi:MAG TPA: hypothetical protein DCS13_00240 [Candidatus Margulisbacteria bacterium]|nr:MAG: hypothetical protein A2X43_04760 [Candidatus Margulisbacteria bacterium GWD2_39_127]HAR61872.1 hypothetical protein [Candidatus Margulisiibacteriota bacterium]
MPTVLFKTLYKRFNLVLGLILILVTSNVYAATNNSVTTTPNAAIKIKGINIILDVADTSKWSYPQDAGLTVTIDADNLPMIDNQAKVSTSDISVSQDIQVQPTVKSSKHSLKCAISINPVLANNKQKVSQEVALKYTHDKSGNKKLDLSKYKQLYYYIKTSTANSELVANNIKLYSKLSLQEKSGKVWVQNNPITINNQNQACVVDLVTSNFSLQDDKNKKKDTEVDLTSIDSIWAIVNLEDDNTTDNPHTYSSTDKLVFYMDNMILSPRKTNRVSTIQLVAATTTNNTNTMKTASIRSIHTLSIGDLTAPVITAIKFDNKEVLESDYVKAKPLISAIIDETGSGLATWNISIIDANNLTVNSTSGFGNLVTGSALVITDNVATALTAGSYSVKITVTDGAGNATTLSTPTFNVSDGFQIKHVLNGPNPFNPKNGSTSIQYQLTDDADVNIYIYSISGEKLWHQHITQGDLNGGSSGFNKVDWNGVNDFDEIVANGVYVVYVIAKNGSTTKTGKAKIMVLK